MARHSGLGKGLGALIPSDISPQTGAVVIPTSGMRDIEITAIDPNPHQPRVHFDEDTLSELAASIRAIGLLQPVLVRPAKDGRYELIGGERRWRAATRAGLRSIPAIIRITDDVSSVEQALVENTSSGSHLLKKPRHIHNFSTISSCLMKILPKKLERVVLRSPIPCAF